MKAVEIHARHTPGFDQRLAGAIDRLTRAAAAHVGRIVQASSLGAEDMVVTDLVARHRLGIAIATLQTGKLHAETLALMPAIRTRYGIDVEIWEPRAATVVQFVRSHGERAMYESVALRKNCCAIRKLEPLSRMLNDRSAWITGLRREQSAQRSDVPFDEVDDAGRIKFNPLADWSQADVWHYIQSFEVPYNALHDRFFPSIGCEPCTRAIALGEDVRAGRWWWESEGAKECGLHVHTASNVASSTFDDARFNPKVPA